MTVFIQKMSKYIFKYLLLHILQIEKSPTLGSIDSSDMDKRILAEQSLEYNLRNKTFCELFPDLVEVCYSQ